MIKLSAGSYLKGECKAMENILMKDGRIETIGEIRHALDLVREYCGNDLSDYLTEQALDCDTLSADYDEACEALEKKNDLMEDLIEEMKAKIYKYDRYSDNEIAQFSVDQIREMICCFSKWLDKVKEIQRI